MTDEDLALLFEYEAWRQAVPTTPDVSIEAFRRQKEAGEDRARIERAINAYDPDRMGDAFDAIEEPTFFERQAHDTLTLIYDTLTAGLELVDERTLTGEPTVRRI